MLEATGQYMGHAAQERDHMARRAILTDREREILSGDIDEGEVEDLDAYQQKIRSRIRRRIEKLDDDLAVLDEVAPEIADDARERICNQPVGQLERLEAKVERLESRLDED